MAVVRLILDTLGQRQAWYPSLSIMDAHCETLRGEHAQQRLAHTQGGKDKRHAFMPGICARGSRLQHARNSCLRMQQRRPMPDHYETDSCGPQGFLGQSSPQGQGRESPAAVVFPLMDRHMMTRFARGVTACPTTAGAFRRKFVTPGSGSSHPCAGARLIFPSDDRRSEPDRKPTGFGGPEDVQKMPRTVGCEPPGAEAEMVPLWRCLVVGELYFDWCAMEINCKRNMLGVP